MNKSMQVKIEMIRDLLKEINWEPTSGFISEENASFLIWEKNGVYVDIEFHLDGCILWGITNFKDFTDAGDMEISLAAIQALKDKFESLQEVGT